MFRLLSFLSWVMRVGLPIASLTLHFGIVAAYARRWNHAAALTVFPFWAWCLLGILMVAVSWSMYRRRICLWLAALWLVTMVVGADETRPLLRSTATAPVPGLPSKDKSQPLLRVISLNCRLMNSVCAEEVIPWQPDIVLFQEAPPPAALEQLARKLYQDGQPMHVLGGYEVAVVTRGKVGYNPSIGMETQKPPWLVRELPCIIALDGRIIHAVCVHLNGAVTDVGLHRASTWNSHYLNRMSRLREMLTVRNLLTLQQLTPAPTIIGGDFNAPAGDAVFRVLEPDLTDAFATVGAGWGDTFPNKTPLLRIDHIYANDQLTPVRARTVETVNSDHRMVVVDYAYK